VVVALAFLKSITFSTFLRRSETVIAGVAIAGVAIGVAAEEARKLLRTGKN
jgi:small-conductance mechanosensitive channel